MENLRNRKWKICVCMCERERERDGEREKKKYGSGDRESHGWREINSLVHMMYSHINPPSISSRFSDGELCNSLPDV